MIIKGHATVGESLVFRQKKGVSRANPKAASPQNEKAKLAQPYLWRWGGGLSYFTFTVPSAGGATAGYNLGFSLLLLRNFSWDSALSFDVGLRYYRAGASISGGGLSGNVTLDYLGALGVANYVVADSQLGQFRIKGGVDFSYLLASAESFNAGNISVSATNPVGSKTDLLLLGGVDYVFKDGGWWVELSYNYGLLNISGSSVNVTNQGLVALAGGSF